MTPSEFIEWCARGIVGFVGGFALYKVKKAEQKKSQAITKEEARQLFFDLLEPVKVETVNTKGDVKEIKDDIKDIKRLIIEGNNK